MTFVLAAFATSTTRRLARTPLPETWRQQGVLASLSSAADVLAAASAPTPMASRRPVLSALLTLAPTDRLAGELLVAALVSALRAVSAELARWAPVEAAEVDALVALGAWEAVCALGGREHPWPDRAVVGRARDRARSALHRAYRHRAHEVAQAEMAERSVDASDGTAVVVAADVLRRAVVTGQLTASSAALVWAVRVEDRTSAELAAEQGKSAESVSMERLRAERALRELVA